MILLFIFDIPDTPNTKTTVAPKGAITRAISDNVCSENVSKAIARKAPVPANVAFQKDFILFPPK